MPVSGGWIWTLELKQFSIRINQLPVSFARWQHGSKLCFATFISRKVTNFKATQQPQKLKKKISADLESLVF
jgi:hypothetical protein